MFEELVWVQSGNTWTSTLSVTGGGSITIQMQASGRQYLPSCYTATITVGTQTFPIPSTEFLKCFYLVVCKEICGLYYNLFLQDMAY